MADNAQHGLDIITSWGTAIAALAAVATLIFQFNQTKKDKLRDDAKNIRSRIELNMLTNSRVIDDMISTEIFIHLANSVADKLFARIKGDADFDHIIAGLKDQQNVLSAIVLGYNESSLAKSFEHSRQQLVDNATFFQGDLAILNYTSNLSSATAIRYYSPFALLNVMSGRGGRDNFVLSGLLTDQSLKDKSRIEIRNQTVYWIQRLSI